ncbi:hypothetical protein PR048_006429 [Dryococelus australis]|uniref:Uncharacterized protein n=1 Tax=Dryococelus australis TaxID=614101 RepID=A0ABQ9ID72_9NEOP|nr:hypothetical protein PR048_006429 [Dryococelus australis]
MSTPARVTGGVFRRSKCPLWNDLYTAHNSLWQTALRNYRHTSNKDNFLHYLRVHAKFRQVVKSGNVSPTVSTEIPVSMLPGFHQTLAPDYVPLPTEVVPLEHIATSDSENYGSSFPLRSQRKLDVNLRLFAPLLSCPFWRKPLNAYLNSGFSGGSRLTLFCIQINLVSVKGGPWWMLLPFCCQGPEKTKILLFTRKRIQGDGVRITYANTNLSLVNSHMNLGIYLDS